MSIHAIPNGYVVRWRNPDGRHKSKTFRHGDGKRTTKQCAEDFHDRVRADLRAYGEVRTLVPKTVGEVAAQWSKQNDIAPKTDKLYRWLWQKQIAPTFQDELIANVRVRDVEEWLSELDTGSVAKRKAAALLSQIFEAARRWEYCRENPVSAARKPKLPAKKAIRPPTPLEVERVRSALLEAQRLGDATLVSVLAYGGLRPQEALGLHWRDIGDRTALVNAPKTGRARSVKLLSPLAHDLAQWSEVTPYGNPDDLVFPSPRGKQVTESGWANWRTRVWYPLFETSEGPQPEHGAHLAPHGSGREDAGEHARSQHPPALGTKFHPYALRHTFVSLLIADGCSIVEVAQQAGHSAQVCLSTYAHVFASEPRRSAEEWIMEARGKVAEKERERL